MGNEETMKIIMAASVMLAEYVLVLVAVLADLWSGIRKARCRGEARRSEALRRTVSKLSQYYNAMMALSVVDAMQMGLMFYMRVACGWNMPLLPVLTVIGAIGIAAIEVKSIYEKSEEKQQRDYRTAASMIVNVLKGINDKDMLKIKDLLVKKWR